MRRNRLHHVFSMYSVLFSHIIFMLSFDFKTFGITGGGREVYFSCFCNDLTL